MKKYYFTWYNYVAQQEQTDFILAKNKKEARQIAIFIMKFFGGNRYTNEDIEVLDEINDNYFYTLEEMKERYKKCNKELPLIEDIEDDEEED